MKCAFEIDKDFKKVFGNTTDNKVFNMQQGIDNGPSNL